MNISLKFALIAGIASATLFSSGSAALAADRYVHIKNHTAVILYRWYASPTNSNSWGADRLVRKQVPPNYTSTIDLNRAGSGCYFDFRAEFKDGDVLEKYGVDVCGGYTIEYYE